MLCKFPCRLLSRNGSPFLSSEITVVQRKSGLIPHVSTRFLTWPLLHLTATQFCYYRPSTYRRSRSKQPPSTHLVLLSSSLEPIPPSTRMTCSQVSVPTLPVLSEAPSLRPPLRPLDPTCMTIQCPDAAFRPTGSYQRLSVEEVMCISSIGQREVHK